MAIIDNSRIAEIGSVEDIFMRPKTEIARRLLYASGRLGGASPWEEFLGSPYSESGWGCYAPVIAGALEQLLQQFKILLHVAFLLCSNG